MTAGNRWSDKSVESMYDKTLLNAEIDIIKSLIPPGSTVCDAGCGEGEGTKAYSQVALVEAFDNCPERLEMANDHLHGNVKLSLHDIRDPWVGKNYDVVISQRVLINLKSWEEQKQAIANLFDIGRRVILCEGYKSGSDALNSFRSFYGLPPIPVPEHNLFLEGKKLFDHVRSLGRHWVGCDASLGAYYLLTRGVQPAITDKFHWASVFNEVSASKPLREFFAAPRFARIMVWAFE